MWKVVAWVFEKLSSLGERGGGGVVVGGCYQVGIENKETMMLGGELRGLVFDGT